MKRICFLLTFFLTGFSFVANQQSLRNTYLVACNNEIFEIHLEPEPEGPEFSEEPGESGFRQPGLVYTKDFICSISE